MPQKRKGPKTHTVLPGGRVQVHLPKPPKKKTKKAAKVRKGPDLKALLDSVKPKRR